MEISDLESSRLIGDGLSALPLIAGDDRRAFRIVRQVADVDSDAGERPLRFVIDDSAQSLALAQIELHVPGLAVAQRDAQMLDRIAFQFGGQVEISGRQVGDLEEAGLRGPGMSEEELTMVTARERDFRVERL